MFRLSGWFCGAGPAPGVVAHCLAVGEAELEPKVVVVEVVVVVPVGVAAALMGLVWAASDGEDEVDSGGVELRHLVEDNPGYGWAAISELAAHCVLRWLRRCPVDHRLDSSSRSQWRRVHPPQDRPHCLAYRTKRGNSTCGKTASCSELGRPPWHNLLEEGIAWKYSLLWIVHIKLRISAGSYEGCDL